MEIEKLKRVYHSTQTKEERIKKAQRAGLISQGFITATHHGELTLAGTIIPCAVLKNGQRVIASRQVIGLLTGTKKGQIQRYLSPKNLQPYLPEKLKNANLDNLIKYEVNGKKGYGFDAELIVDLCNMYIKAREDNILLASQLRLAHKAQIIISSLAKVGIVGLIDEVTGYEKVREKDALQALLDKYLQKEYATWAKRFPDEFYTEIFRLKQWTFKDLKHKPSIIGKYTTDLVYDRIAPDLTKKLKELTPKKSVRLHQFLTIDLGVPALNHHISNVITLMKVAEDWDQFKSLLDRIFPVKTVHNFLNTDVIEDAEINE